MICDIMTNTLIPLLVSKFPSKCHKVSLKNYSNITFKMLSYKIGWKKNNLLLEYALKVIKYCK